MKIGLIGFGKTGKAVANVVVQHEVHALEWVFKNSTPDDLRTVPELLGYASADPGLIISRQEMSAEELLSRYPVDAIIDFSSTEGIYGYGKAAAERGIRIISAISHYGPDELALLQELSEHTAVFWSPNITLGVNYLLFAAHLLKKIAPDVDIEVIEEHFKGKDGISGTAMRIAETLDLEEENISSIRAGGIVGKHEVVFGFPYQTVRLVHESISREAFGNGALFVAENLVSKSKGLYRFEDILQPYFMAGQN